MPKMRTSFQGLLRLLAKSLYSEPDVFVRELLQNAHDSIQLRRVYRSEPAGEIRIDVDEPARTLSFTDNGTGMDRPEIEEFLSVIGSTGTGSHARELAARDVMVATIGQFGIGLLSAFVVAERIEVYTYKPGTVQAWRWINHGGEDYQLEALPVGAQPPGTRVVVTLVPDRTAFLDGHLLRQIVRRYADFLPFPILLNGFGPINAVNAPWHESSWSDPVEQERSLAAFLSQRYSDSVLLVIPVNLSRPRSVGGLYVPARYTPGSQASGTVDLFQARMCIRPNDVALLPEWARFVRGVVDCPDLHPTAARDNVLRDEVYHTLREALGKVIVAALLDLADRDRPRFLQLCDWHHDAIKGMAVQHPGFGAAVLDYLPFETNRGQLTLPDYLGRQTAVNGKRPLYFFTHEADANQFYTLCEARSLLAINAGRSSDETLLRRYAGQHTETVDLKPLDRLDDPTLYQRLDVAEQAEYARLERAVDQVLAEQEVGVKTQVRRFQPAHLSAILLAGQRISAFDDMERALERRPFLLEGLAELAGDVRDRLRQQPLDFFLNADHPLVQRLRELTEPDHPCYRPLLAGLYHGALLNAQHRLTAVAARRFHADLQDLLLKHLELQVRARPDRC